MRGTSLGHNELTSGVGGGAWMGGLGMGWWEKEEGVHFYQFSFSFEKQRQLQMLKKNLNKFHYLYQKLYYIFIFYGIYSR